MRPAGEERAPYLAALVASSCKARPMFCAASGFSMIFGPSIVARDDTSPCGTSMQ